MKITFFSSLVLIPTLHHRYQKQFFIEKVKKVFKTTSNTMGPVCHVVLFEMEGYTKRLEMDANKAGETLLDIPGVYSVQFGRSFTTHRNEGYTHCLCVP